MRRARAILLQEWTEGALTLARREPLLLTFLQDDGSTAEEEPVAEPEGEAVLAEYRCLRRCQIRAEAVRLHLSIFVITRRQMMQADFCAVVASGAGVGPGGGARHGREHLGV